MAADEQSPKSYKPLLHIQVWVRRFRSTGLFILMYRFRSLPPGDIMYAWAVLCFLFVTGDPFKAATAVLLIDAVSCAGYYAHIKIPPEIFCHICSKL